MFDVYAYNSNMHANGSTNNPSHSCTCTLVPLNVAAMIRGNSCSQQTKLGDRANLTVGARDKNEHCEMLPCSLQLFS